MMDPYPKPKKAGGNGRDHNAWVAEDVAAREGGHQRRNDRGAWQKNDVNVRMSKKPEKVLIKQHISAFCGIKEMRVGRSVHQQHGAHQHHGWHREDHHERKHQLLPDEQRHTVKSHSRGAILQDGYNQANRDCKCGKLRKSNHLRPEIDAFPWRESWSRERNVAEPSRISANVEKQPAPQQQTSADIDEVRKSCQTRKGDVPCPHHQRHQVNSESLIHHGHGK